MPVEGGTVIIPVVPETAGFSAALSSGVQKSSSGVMGAAKSFGQKWGALIGIGMGIGFAKSSLSAFDDFEKATETLQVGLDKIHQPQAFDDISKWASGFADQTGILQADILTMSARLANMGSAFFKAAGPDAAAELEKLTAGFEDMAAATGKSVNMLMRSLGPAILNTPDKAISLLQKYGVLTDAQAVKTKALTDAGNNLAATQMEINAIQAAFGGTAAKTATAYDKLGERINKVEIFAGGLLSQALEPLIPVLDFAAKNATLLLSAFAAYKALNFLPGLLLNIGASLEAMGLEATAAGALRAGIGIESLATALGPLGVVLTGVVAEIVLLNKASQEADQTAQSAADTLSHGSHTAAQWRDAMNSAGASTHGFAVKTKEVVDHVKALAGITDGATIPSVKSLTLAAGSLAARMDASNTAMESAVFAADKLAAAQAALNAQWRTAWSLENQAAGGLVALAQADSDAATAKNALAVAEAKVTKLAADGKKGTDAYTQAVKDRNAAELASISAQANLDQAAQSQYAIFQKSNTTLAEADSRLRAQAQAAGLSAQETDALVAKVNALYQADSKIPKDVITSFLANGLAGNLQDLAKYNQYLATLDGKQVFITVHTNYVDTGAVPHGGIQ